MKKTTIEFTIPKVPGSVNHLYGRTRFGKMYIKKEGRMYKALVHRTIINNVAPVPDEIFYGRLCIRFIIFFGTRAKRDLDNCMKILWDSLESVLFEDDGQIDEYTVVRDFSKENPGVDVQVYNLS